MISGTILAEMPVFRATTMGRAGLPLRWRVGIGHQFTAGQRGLMFVTFD